MNYKVIGLDPPTPNCSRAYFLYGSTFDPENDGTLNLDRVDAAIVNLPRNAQVIPDVERHIGERAAAGEERALNQMVTLYNRIKARRRDLKVSFYAFPTAHHIGTHLPSNRTDYFVAGRQCAFMGLADSVYQSMYQMSDWNREYWDHVCELTRAVADAEDKPIDLVYQTRFTESDPNVVLRFMPVRYDQFTEDLQMTAELIGPRLRSVQFWMEGLFSFMRYSVYDPANHTHDPAMVSAINAAKAAFGTRYTLGEGASIAVNEALIAKDISAEAATYISAAQQVFETSTKGRA